MKKCIVFILVIIAFITGCTKDEHKKDFTIILLGKTKITYNTKIHLYDLISIENGKFITENYLLDTNSLKTEIIAIEYKDSNNDKQKYLFEIKIIDNISPLLSISNSITLEKNNNIDLIDKFFYGDNYDKKVNIEIIGLYDLNRVGEYSITVRATDSSNNSTVKSTKVKVVEKIISKQVENKTVEVSDIIKKHKTKNTSIGIDVSYHQKDIDFKKVKESGIEFVIIRIGYGKVDEKHIMDSKYLENIKLAKEAGLKVGVYYYSYSTSKEESIEQAKWILENTKDQILELGITFDWEYFTKFPKLNLSFKDLNDIGYAFLNEIKNNNQKAMLYGSAYYLNNIWNIPEYDTWLAHYTEKTYYKKDYSIWQLTDKGKINGIDTNVDINIMYK